MLHVHVDLYNIIMANINSLYHLLPRGHGMALVNNNYPIFICLLQQMNQYV